jgi:hypothetical protein
MFTFWEMIHNETLSLFFTKYKQKETLSLFFTKYSPIHDFEKRCLY